MSISSRANPAFASARISPRAWCASLAKPATTYAMESSFAKLRAKDVPVSGGRFVDVECVVREEAARLVAPELFVMPAETQQLVVRAAFHDAALLEHHEAVHAGDGREAVGDRDHRLAFHQLEQLLLDCELDLAVERGGGLVEHQDRRVLEDHARERNALALAAGKLDAALADVRFVADVVSPVPQADDEVVRLGLGGRGQHLGVARVRTAVADVGGD